LKVIMSQTFSVRRKSEVPFYCKPIGLFLCEWLLMLVSFQMHISVNSYPDLSLALFVFALSSISLLLGYYTVRAATYCLNHTPKIAPHYQIGLLRLRRVQWLLLSVAIAIVIMNFAAEGKPPIFGLLGDDTLNYMKYGKLKQVLNTAVLAVFVSASLETSKKRKYLVYCFSLLCMLAYVTRGFLLLMLAQGLFVFSLRTRINKRLLYLVASTTLIVAVVIAGLIGNGRSASTSQAFVSYFGIQPAYADWPMILLWAISYVATPFSNLCWIIHSHPYTHPSATFLTSLLPAFWAPPPLESTDLGSSSIIDGVHSYLAKYYLDLWYFGVFLINYVWGLISGYLSVGDRLASRALTSSVLLAAMAFMFFADYLTFLSVVMELLILHFLQRYAIKEITVQNVTRPEPAIP
jgi:oligosaccharide repeat unit polymerase